MDRLLEELTGQGMLGAADAEGVRAHSDEHGVPLDSALLELDLVDEESLLRALASCAGIPSAAPADLLHVDPTVRTRLPESFSRRLSMCPVRRSGDRLVALVERPLRDDWVEELRDVLGIELEQRVAPAHYLSITRERVYATPAGERAHALEARLEQRRNAEGVTDVLSRWRDPRTLSAALADVLTFAARRIDHALFLQRHGDALRVLPGGAGAPAKGTTLTLPAADSALRPALAHGGYFLGPLPATDADRQFYAALDRPPPRWVCIMPAPLGSTSSLLLLLDNGERGIATRWVAEIALLVSRIGQRNVARPPAAPERAAAEPAPLDCADAVAAAINAPSVAPEPAPSEVERRVLEKLRRACSDAGLPLEAFVDHLLAPKTAAPAADSAPASLLAGEVKGFFEKLAVELPAQLARGMEAAFRDLAPRVAPPVAEARPAPTPPTTPASPPRPAASVDVEVVRHDAAPREVQSYQSKRRKTERVKF